MSSDETSHKQFLGGTKTSISQQTFNHQQNKNLKHSGESSRDVNQILLSKRTISNQLNLPSNAKIFKDLIPTNVNDSVLEDIYPKRKKQRSHLGSHTSTGKDPEPVLGDYLMPIAPLELKLEQCNTRVTVKDVDSFNYIRLYDLFKALNVDS